MIADVDAFLRPEDAELHAPGAMKSLPDAVELVAAAIGEGRRIAIFGDYDADGVTATALLQRGLTAAGAEVVTFSPLEDRALPRDLDALYLGGGVSEAYVARLSSNRAFIESFRRARAKGIPTYAECGGLLYCVRSLRTSVRPSGLTLSSARSVTASRPITCACNAVSSDRVTVI